MSKLETYIGFAKKSRNLVTGSSTAIYYMEKKKVKLLIIDKQASENTVKKLIKSAQKNNTKYVIYEDCQSLSQATGEGYKSVLAIMDDNFAKIILKEIDNSQ